MLKNVSFWFWGKIVYIIMVNYIVLKYICICIFVDIVYRDLKLENIFLVVDLNNLEDKFYIKVSIVWIDEKM